MQSKTQAQRKEEDGRNACLSVTDLHLLKFSDVGVTLQLQVSHLVLMFLMLMKSLILLSLVLLSSKLLENKVEKGLKKTKRA